MYAVSMRLRCTLDFFFLCYTIFSLTGRTTCIDITWLDSLMSESHPSLITEYTFFTHRKTWNEARSVCTEMGGDLAKVDSRSIINIIVGNAEETFNESIFVRDYWVGLTEITEGQFWWSFDCTSLTWTVNYNIPWNHKKKCYKLEKTGHTGRRDQCEDNNSFLCQRILNTSCTMEVPTSNYTYVNTTSIDENGCSLDCFNDINCAASFFMPSDTCIKVQVNTSDPFLYMSVKNCVIVTRNQTQVNPQNDTSSDPKLNCAGMVTTSTTSTTSSTSTTTTVSTTTTTSTTTTSCTCPTTSTCPTITTCPQPTSYTVNLTNEEILAIAREISRNLTVDVKSTSAYQRKLNSAGDKRSSSTAVGFVGLVFIMLPLSILVLADLVGILYVVKQNVQSCLTRWQAYSVHVIPGAVLVKSTDPGDVFDTHYYT